MFIEAGILVLGYLGVRTYLGVRAYEKPAKEITENKAESLQRYNNSVGVASMALGLLAQFFPVLIPFNLVLLIYYNIPYLRRVENSLYRDKKINSETLFLFSHLLCLGLNQYFIVSLKLWLSNYSAIKIEKAKDQSDKSMKDVFDKLPETVWVLTDNAEVETPIRDIKINDIVVVNTGMVIPVDGTVSEGIASIGQHALTGESQPVEKTVGDQVFASTVVFAGRICIKVEKSGEDSTFFKIQQILINSNEFKTNVHLKGEEWSQKFVTPMFAISWLMLPIMGPVSTVVFIHSHIGASIRIFSPMMTLNYMSAASQNGILIKDGRAIEGLSKIDTILFDKTGTLTTEMPEVGEIIVHGIYEEDEILTYAASGQQKLAHPIANAIVKKAKENNLVLPQMSDSDYKIGYGITIMADDMIIRVGSKRFMTEEGLTIPNKVEETEDAIHSKGNSLIHVAINDEISGSIELRPQLRPEIKEIIKGLRQHGIKYIGIVSGDHRKPTERLAQELGIEEYFYDILPENKADIVEKLQNEGRSVCFVGDGINDSIAMKRANISVSLSGATTVATDMAQVVFIDGTLSQLCLLFDFSERLNKKLKRCLNYTIIAGGLNLCGAFIFHYGIFTSLLVPTFFACLLFKDAQVSPKELR